MADRPELVKDLQRQVTLLETDLRVRSAEEPEFATPLRAEYDEARAAGRTAATYETWRDERVTQVAAAWVLGTVFVRFCEDNGLIEWPFLAGPGERLADAEERHEAYFRSHPERNDRDWIIESFTHLSAAHPTAAGLFDRRHNPLWEITPSFEAATALLQFWRRRADDGEIRYNFTDESRETRFLGDIYQDLSEAARKTYALLQTPEFVEEFILDLTLEPAIEEFGLTGLRTIDPACGSGHFLLGLFRRLLAKWKEAEPDTDNWELIRRSLDSVHGCDKNPFAVSIARFRLLVAVLHEADQKRLETAPEFPINIAVGDSLIHGRGAPGIQDALFTIKGAHTYATEDVEDFIPPPVDILGRSSYHVVVGNPPYIEVKDKWEKKNYKNRYGTCAGLWVLTVPFVERMFQLAIRTHANDRDAGYVGQITGSGFMRHEFGKKLIEDFLPNVHLTHVIDTAGVHISGHGTPTVILVGRNHIGRMGDPIRAAIGLNAGSDRIVGSEDDLAWSAIVDQIDQPGSRSNLFSVQDIDRERFTKFPWAMIDDEKALLMTAISAGHFPFSRVLEDIGYTGQTNSDGAFLASARHLVRAAVDPSMHKNFATGDDIREYRCSPAAHAIFPYDSAGQLRMIDLFESTLRRMWPLRTQLWARATFGGSTYRDEGREWWAWHQVAKSRLTGPVITWPMTETMPHFVYLRECMLHNRHAPILKLAQGSSEQEYCALAALLNSSVSTFWLKQVCHNKGEGGGARVDSGYAALGSEAWRNSYEFTGTKVQEFPLPADLPVEFGRVLDLLADRLSAQEPWAVCADAEPTRERLDRARAEHARIRGRMIALQEELDWHVYGAYDLLGDREVTQLTAPDRDGVPELKLGERAFEIVLARKRAAGEIETAWFARHGSMPITEIPKHWPEWYRRIVQARIDTIDKRQRDIGLIERPECKRRWAGQPWGKKEAEALRTWLLDRCERRDLWFGLRDGVEQPRTLTVNQLADQFRDDADMLSVAQLYASDHLNKRDLTLAQVLERIVADEHVPCLAALRYKDSGLRKRAQWEDVWEQQREEDRTEQRLDIAVPPKYTSADFRKNSYWAQRGKLDVPKERFISYLEASPDSDPTLLLGWAGWDHKDQAQALVNLVNDRTTDAGWGIDKLQPMLAGLAEVLPWVRQWHGEHDEAWGGVPAEEFQAFLDEQRTKHHLTEQDLTGWRPEPTRRGRRGAKGSTT